MKSDRNLCISDLSKIANIRPMTNLFCLFNDNFIILFKYKMKNDQVSSLNESHFRKKKMENLFVKLIDKERELKEN